MFWASPKKTRSLTKRLKPTNVEREASVLAPPLRKPLHTAAYCRWLAPVSRPFVVKRLQFARRTDHFTLTVRLSYDLTCESPIARVSVPHAIVRKLPMMQEDRACGVRDCRRPRMPLGSAGRTRAFFAIRSSGTAVDRQRLIRPQPHSRHSSQHPAPSWVSA